MSSRLSWRRYSTDFTVEAEKELKQLAFETYQMSATVLQHKATVETLRDTRDLGLPEYRVLLRVHEMGDRARVRDIMSSLGIRSSSVTQAANSLERKGMVTRIGDQDDGRATIICVTPEGKDALDAVNSALETRLVELWSPAADKSDAARQVTVIMGRMIEGLAQHSRPRPVASGYVTSEYITTVAENYRRIAEALKRDSGLSIGEWRVLRYAKDSGGIARMHEIGTSLVLPANTVTWAADRLASHGLVRRVADQEVVRGVLIEVTDAGYQTLAATQKTLDDSQQRLRDSLTSRQLADAFDGTKLMVEAQARIAAGRV